MKNNKTNEATLLLLKKYPPSEPCECIICKSYCSRPGWWTVNQASKAINAGFGSRMMLEVSPEFSFGVLSPAFKGCESNFALQEYAKFGCNFLKNGLCEIHDKSFYPLECNYCHHARQGFGLVCHADIEKDWKTPEGQKLVDKWVKMTKLFERYNLTDENFKFK